MLMYINAVRPSLNLQQLCVLTRVQRFDRNDLSSREADTQMCSPPGGLAPQIASFLRPRPAGLMVSVNTPCVFLHIFLAYRLRTYESSMPECICTDAHTINGLAGYVRRKVPTAVFMTGPSKPPRVRVW